MPEFIPQPRYASIDFGPVKLDGYLMPDGTFRQSLRSTAKALGMFNAVFNRDYLYKALKALKSGEIVSGQIPSGAEEVSILTPKTASGEILEISTGQPGFAAIAHTLDLPTVDRDWETISPLFKAFSAL